MFVVYLVGLVAAMSVGTFAALRAAIGAIRPALVVLPVNAAFVAVTVWWWAIDGDPMPIVFILVPLCMLLWLGVYSNAMETWASQTRQCYGGRACTNCGYDLRGLPTTTCCPECGPAPPASTTP